MKSSHCELCNADAAVFCPSDNAFLCRSCDTKVHGANFLVARHVRQSVCSVCKKFTQQEVVGVDSQPLRAICNSCSDEDGVVSSGYSSCSSDCISSTTSPAKEYSGGRRDSSSSQGFESPSNKKRQRGGESRRVDLSKAEEIFIDWCGKLGVGADVAVGMACRGLSACSESLTVSPFRVCLAASMWLALRLSGDKTVSTLQVLKRLEEISGVPAKVIVAAELKLERWLNGRRRLQRRRIEMEEGWAEC